MDLVDLIKTSVLLPPNLLAVPLLAGYRARVHLGDGCRNPYTKSYSAVASWRHGFELAHQDITQRHRRPLF